MDNARVEAHLKRMHTALGRMSPMRAAPVLLGAVERQLGFVELYCAQYGFSDEKLRNLVGEFWEAMAQERSLPPYSETLLREPPDVALHDDFLGSHVSAFCTLMERTGWVYEGREDAEHALLQTLDPFEVLLPKEAEMAPDGIEHVDKWLGEIPAVLQELNHQSTDLEDVQSLPQPAACARIRERAKRTRLNPSEFISRG